MDQWSNDMKMNQLVPAAVLSAVVLAGCASGPDFKTYSCSLAPVKEGEGRIWFYRPSKMLGAAVQPAVLLNGEEVGKAQPGCFFYADRPAGAYEVKCTTEWSNKGQLALAANSTKYVRLTMMIGVIAGHVIPKEIDEATALKELEHCKLISAGGADKEKGEEK
jgi:hypothetical protein